MFTGAKKAKDAHEKYPEVALGGERWKKAFGQWEYSLEVDVKRHNNIGSKCGLVRFRYLAQSETT